MPSYHVCSTFSSPGSLHFLCHDPPGKQQLYLLERRCLAHWHKVGGGVAIPLIFLVPLVLAEVVAMLVLVLGVEVVMAVVLVLVLVLDVSTVLVVHTVGEYDPGEFSNI